MTGKDEAAERLYEAYGGKYDEEVGDLAAFHNAATSFLATIDSHGPDELPDDLDADTKRQINTARSQLPRAISGIEEAAAERLNNSKEGGEADDKQ